MKSEEDVYKAFGLTDKMVEQVLGSKENTQKQLDVFLENMKNIRDDVSQFK